jgi:predicted nucleotidyltransferase component of viral defense system
MILDGCLITQGLLLRMPFNNQERLLLIKNEIDMIDLQSLITWKKYAPWPSEIQVEQDLIITRALIDIFNHPLLQQEVALRGAASIQRCFFQEPSRYSEDIDLVQNHSKPIGPIFNAIREVLDPWLGEPKRKINEGRACLFYTFNASDANATKLRLKIEINTREHYNFLGLINKKISMETPWFTGSAEIVTYKVEELLGTKLRALYQRNKSRDLYDLARALESLPMNLEKIIFCFQCYIEAMNLRISRAEFEKNLYEKKELICFENDIIPLLPTWRQQYNFAADFHEVMHKLIHLLPGEPWHRMKK